MSASLPQIRNASLPLLKIVAMEISEELVMNKSELPKTYKTPQQLATYIMRNYDFFLVVRRTLNEGEYRITRVKDASEIKLATPQRRREKATSSQLKPEHNLSLADLEQVADIKLNFAERDEDALGPLGADAAKIAAVRAMVAALKYSRDDVSFLMSIGMAKDAKNTTRTTLYADLSNLRRMAQNALDDINYGTFKFEGLQALSDAEFAMKARLIHHRASKPEIQALLLPGGCTTIFLDGIAEKLNTFLLDTEAIDDRENERTLGTYARTLLGNNIYREIVKICNTGKTFYQYTSPDPAKWEDYVVGN